MITFEFQDLEEIRQRLLYPPQSDLEKAVTVLREGEE